MSAATADRRDVVFDCVVFAQALIRPTGPAGALLDLARRREFRLFISAYVIAEIQQLPYKLRGKYRVRLDEVEDFVAGVTAFAEFVPHIPPIYVHPTDPKDSHYIDLAIAAGASLITSRDHDLLDLMDISNPAGRDFRTRFPTIEILTPDVLLNRLKPRP